MTTADPSNDEQFQLLLDTVENLRKTHFNHLEKEMVRATLLLHCDADDITGESYREAEKIVEQFLARSLR